MLRCLSVYDGKFADGDSPRNDGSYLKVHDHPFAFYFAMTLIILFIIILSYYAVYLWKRAFHLDA